MRQKGSKTCGVAGPPSRNSVGWRRLAWESPTLLLFPIVRRFGQANVRD